MTVEINTERKGIEVSWDPSGGVSEPPVDEKPPGYPAHPIVLPPEGGAHPEHPIFLPPFIWGGGNEPFPTPPIEIPEVPDQGPVEPPAGGTEPPGYNPPVGLPEPPLYPYPVDAEVEAVQVFGQGQDGDWSNTAVQPNDGLAFLSYPKGFTGESYIEVRKLDGTLVDAGVITVE